MSLIDRQPASISQRLAAHRAEFPSATIDAPHVVAALADDRLVASLFQPNVTRAQQVELVKRALPAAARDELAGLIDNALLPITDTARNFIEAVLDRAPLLPGHPIGPGEPALVAQAAAWARLRTPPHSEEAQGDFITVRAAPKNHAHPVVALSRIRLTPTGTAAVSVTNASPGRHVSPPGTQLQFVNGHTGSERAVTIDARGDFPAGVTLAGKPGDVFSVTALDGTASITIGKLTVPGIDTVDLIKEPAVHADHLEPDGSSRVVPARFTGPLFPPTLDAAGVQQGQLSDCYLQAALSALALHLPDTLQQLIVDHKDGTYSVTFREKDWSSGLFRPVPVKLDADLYLSATGQVLYGAHRGNRAFDAMPLWNALIEKAWATWKGSYDAIGHGGLSSDVFEALLGKPSRYLTVDAAKLDWLWHTLLRALDTQQPATASTAAADGSGRFTNSGVVGDHCYAVLGVRETNGDRFITVRNPWGFSATAGVGTADGVLELTFLRFAALFAAVTIGAR